MEDVCEEIMDEPAVQVEDFASPMYRCALCGATSSIPDELCVPTHTKE